MYHRYEGIEHEGRTVVAVDPSGCGCTECITGEYVPLDQANVELLKGIALGQIANNTYSPVIVTVRPATMHDPLEAGSGIVYEVQLEHLRGVWAPHELDHRDAEEIVREARP